MKKTLVKILGWISKQSSEDIKMTVFFGLGFILFLISLRITLSIPKQGEPNFIQIGSILSTGLLGVFYSVLLFFLGKELIINVCEKIPYWAGNLKYDLENETPKKKD